MEKTLQVGNLDASVSNRDLCALFEPHGTVRTARVATHLGDGLSTGVGFVEMESVACGDAAVAALNGQEFRGLILVVTRRMSQATC